MEAQVVQQPDPEYIKSLNDGTTQQHAQNVMLQGRGESQNGGDEEYFIGSADSMKRNLESRVEVVTPVEADGLRQELRSILDIQLSDRRSAWEMSADGTYVQYQPENEDQAVGSQTRMIQLAEKRAKKARKAQKGKKIKIQGRNLR